MPELFSIIVLGIPVSACGCVVNSQFHCDSALFTFITLSVNTQCCCNIFHTQTIYAFKTCTFEFSHQIPVASHHPWQQSIHQSKRVILLRNTIHFSARCVQKRFQNCCMPHAQKWYVTNYNMLQFMVYRWGIRSRSSNGYRLHDVGYWMKKTQWRKDHIELYEATLGQR